MAEISESFARKPILENKPQTKTCCDAGFSVKSVYVLVLRMESSKFSLLVHMGFVVIVVVKEKTKIRMPSSLLPENLRLLNTDSLKVLKSDM